MDLENFHVVYDFLRIRNIFMDLEFFMDLENFSDFIKNKELFHGLRKFSDFLENKGVFPKNRTQIHPQKAT